MGNAHEAEANFSSVFGLDPHQWWAQFQLTNR